MSSCTRWVGLAALVAALIVAPRAQAQARRPAPHLRSGAKAHGKPRNKNAAARPALKCPEPVRVQLQAVVNQRCKKPGIGIRCTDRMRCPQVKSSIRKGTNCKNARNKFIKKCGSDPGHAQVVAGYQNAVDNCREVMKKVCR